VYDSRGEDGLLGPGWSLNGLSSITRCNLTRAQDGYATPVLLDEGDKFCIDGNRLRVTSGSYSIPGATYQTEIETFSRIKSFGEIGNHSSLSAKIALLQQHEWSGRFVPQLPAAAIMSHSCHEIRL
jgi:hypothetical protein